MSVAIVNALREAFNTGRTRCYEWRLGQLTSMLRMVNENVDELCTALSDDLHKARYEAMLTEVFMVRNELGVAINNLKKWMEPEKAPKTLLTLSDTAYVQREPLGVTLIIGAWNYPVQLTLVPVVGAIAAGNCVLLKPSEVAKSTEGLISKLVEQYMDKECVRVFCGGAAETKELLEANRFDKIFYTGNSQVARVVTQAAARHLTPVTLELGGKSPTFVDETVDLTMAARRIVWGKFLNCGQTCIAPDYVMMPAEIRDHFVEECKKTLKEFYGEDAEKSSDYGRIVNERHVARINKLLSSSKGRIAVGGTVKSSECFIEPTIVVDVDTSDSLMQEEIFGPILPIITVSDANEAIRIINERHKPLALYVFTNRASLFTDFRQRTSSGGLLFNDTLVHNASESTPFGGVGESGYGAYHGHFTFEDFSHRRTCLEKYTGMESFNSIRYPPYVESRLSLVDKMLVNKPGSFLSRWFFGSSTSAKPKETTNGN